MLRKSRRFAIEKNVAFRHALTALFVMICRLLRGKVAKKFFRVAKRKRKKWKITFSESCRRIPLAAIQKTQNR